MKRAPTSSLRIGQASQMRFQVDRAAAQRMAREALADSGTRSRAIANLQNAVAIADAAIAELRGQG